MVIGVLPQNVHPLRSSLTRSMRLEVAPSHEALLGVFAAGACDWVVLPYASDDEAIRDFGAIHLIRPLSAICRPEHRHGGIRILAPGRLIWRSFELARHRETLDPGVARTVWLDEWSVGLFPQSSQPARHIADDVRHRAFQLALAGHSTKQARERLRIRERSFFRQRRRTWTRLTNWRPSWHPLSSRRAHSCKVRSLS